MTLQRYIAAGNWIKAPKLQVVGGVRLRLWTDRDVERARKLMKRSLVAKTPPNPSSAAHPMHPLRRMRAADRRKNLIAVAVRLFATRGFSGTTTKAIAEASGVSEAIIFHHFKGKEDLYDAILREKARQEGYEQMMDALRELARHDDDEGFVFHLISYSLQSYERDVDSHRLMLYSALERPDFTQVARRILGAPLLKLVSSYVARRQRAGIFHKGNPKVLAFIMMALPAHFGLVEKVINSAPTYLGVPSQELATTFTRVILDGMRVAKGAERNTGKGSQGVRFTRNENDAVRSAQSFLFRTG
jgi:AcrR family transcriptional regulator